MRVASVISSAVWMGIGCVGCVGAQAGVTPIAITGDAVPGVPGAVFGSVVGEVAQVDPQGNVCFSGRWAGPTAIQGGIFTGRPGNWNPGFLYGEQSPPGPDGTWIGGMSGEEVQFVFGSGNRIATTISVMGHGVNGSNDRAVIAGDAALPVRVARTGSSAVGAIAPWMQLSARPVMNASGQYAVFGSVSTASGYHAIAVGGAGEPAAVIAQSTGPVPGLPPGSVFGNTIFQPVISDTGVVGFTGSFTEPGGPVRAAVFRHEGGVLSRVATLGGSAPPMAGLPGGATFSELARPSIGRGGEMAFTAFAGGVPAIWMTDADGSNLRGVASGGSSLPGAPATALLSFTNANIGPTGDLAFVSRYATGPGVTGSSNERLWMHREGQTSLWLTEGVQAPGLPAGVGITLGSMRPTELNARGQIALLTPVTGPGVTAGNQWALFGLEADGRLMTIARTGDLFEVAPGDLRTIEFITLAVASMTDTGVGGGPRALADDGTLVFTLRFTDFTSGVFTTTIPAPASMAVIAMASLFASRRRRPAPA